MYHIEAINTFWYVEHWTDLNKMTVSADKTTFQQFKADKSNGIVIMDEIEYIDIIKKMLTTEVEKDNNHP